MLRFVVCVERIEQWLCSSNDVTVLVCDLSRTKVCVQFNICSIVSWKRRSVNRGFVSPLKP